MTPEQAHFLLNEVYIPQIRNEQKTTSRIIGAVPADKLDYTPDPMSMTSWKLASHIASSEMFFMSGVANGAFDRANGAIPESVKTPADLVKWYDENHAKAVAKLAAMTPADMVKDITFAIFTLPAINYTGLMLSHSVHHRGQLSAYLRPMGAKVPRIYGGSADEPIDMTQPATQAARS
jgi:uncharacterized damage-inducible protein DinB